jgi:hypothetical protein
MKKLLLLTIILLGFCFQNNVKAQAGGVVFDPTNLEQSISNGTILSSLGISLTSLDKAQQKLEKIKEATTWIETMKSVQDFIIMVETMSCMVKDLRVTYDICIAEGLLDEINSCYSEFRYRVNVNQLESGLELLNLVLKSGFQMERGERLETLKTAMSKFINAQIELRSFNLSLKRSILKDHMVKEIDKEMERALMQSIQRYKR